MRPLYLEIFVLSLGVLLFEIAYTRVFSFKLVYYFTYGYATRVGRIAPQ